MHTQKNVTHLIIGANAVLQTTNVPAALRGLGLKKKGETLCSAAGLIGAGTEFQFVYKKNDGSVVETPFYNIDNLLSKKEKAPAALAPQISDIGYNGTDGDIVETNSGNYLVSLGLKDIGKMIGNKRLYKFGEFVAPLTAVKSDIALALAGSIALNQSKDAWIRVIAKATCSNAGLAWAGNHNATVVKGSKFITVGTNLDYNVNTPLAVGDFVKIGTVGAGITSVSGTYKVTELVSGTVFKVDRNVTEASGTYAGATDDMTVVAAATGLLAATKWGVRLTGNDANAPYEVGKFAANLVYFSVGVSTDFQTTEVRLTQTPFIGDGTYKQLSDLDWFLQANGKEKYRIAEYPVNFTPNIASADTANFVYTFTFKDDSTDVIGGRAESLLELILVTLGSTLSDDIKTNFGF